MDNQTLFLITATLAGIAIGVLIMYFLSGKGSNSAKSVAQVEEKLTKYQEDVVSHFEQTADLVDELTQSYKKVFDHLGQSARELLTDEQVKEQIEKRKDRKITLGFLTEESDAEVVETVSEESVEESNENDDEIVEQQTNESKDALEQDVEELIEDIEAEMKKPDDA
jgi:uncharacterized membrane-anchored protein YhcB (DUF1043 family)